MGALSMDCFTLGDWEKIHLAVDLAQRFIRGEVYHGDKPQVLLQEFDSLLEKIRDVRHAETYALEDRSLLDRSVRDAE
jgi:hypothetical protein